MSGHPVLVRMECLERKVFMKYKSNRLRKIYDRTSGRCHICHKQLAFSNYGKANERGAWEVEHSVPRARGGTDHLNNLYAACIKCNREKQAETTRSARSRNGKTRAPYSRKKHQKIRQQNRWIGAGLGALTGTRFGPAGIIIGTILGATLGDNVEIDR